MQAIILCGGESSRMQPLSNKNFFKIQSVPLIQHRVEDLQKAGFSKFIFVVSPAIQEQVQELVKKLDLTAEILVQKQTGGMSQAILSIPKDLLNQPSLVVSANDSVDLDLLSQLKQKSENMQSDALIVGKKITEYFPGGYLVVDDNNMLQSIVEKPDPNEQPSDMINIVYHVFKNPDKFQDLISQLQKGSSSDDIYERALASLIESGGQVEVFPYKGAWQALKNPWHAYTKFRMYVEKSPASIHDSAQVHPTATIEGHVIIDANTKIDANVVIKGPAYIGKNTIVGVGSFIRESFIEHDCLIGYNSEITRSVFQDNSSTHTAFIGDSIVGSHVQFAHGVCTANQRLDKGLIEGKPKLGVAIGNNVKVGIGVKFMPGVRVGANSIIMPSCILKSNIPANTKVPSPFPFS